MLRKLCQTRCLIGLSLLIGATFAFKCHFTSESARLMQMKQTWETSILDTDSYLKREIKALGADATLPVALAEQRLYTISQLWDGKIKKGYIGSLGLYGKTCAPLIEVNQGGHDSCSTETADFSTKFTAIKGIPALTVWHRMVIDGTAHKLMASVPLDAEWLNRFASLKPLFDDGRLTISGDTDSDRVALARLVSDPNLALYGATSFWVASSLQFGSPGTIQDVTTFLIALLLGIQLVALALGAMDHHKTDKALEETLGWVNDLKLKSPQTIILPAPENRPSQGATLAINLRHSIGELVSSLLKSWRSSEERNELLDKRILDLMANLHESRLELAKLPFLHSLASQVDQQSYYLYQELSYTHSTSEDIADVLSISLSRELQKLKDLAHRWYIGSKQQSPRKFFRSLSERPIGNSNELVEDLAFLYKTTGNAINAVINVAIQNRKISQKSARLIEIVKHRIQLINPHDELEPATNLSEVLTEAMAMAQNQNSLFLGTWANDLAKLTMPKIECLNIPKFVWLAVIYHCFMYFSRMKNPGQPFSLRLDVVKKGGQQHLVFDAGPKGNAAFDQSEHELELAYSICRELPLRLSPLPSLAGHDVLALSWTEAADTSIANIT